MTIIVNKGVIVTKLWIIKFSHLSLSAVLAPSAVSEKSTR